MLPGGICGKPAVDSLDDLGYDDGKFYMCADHWDEMDAQPTDDDWSSEWSSAWEDDDYPF